MKSRELDREVAEKVFGRDMKPCATHHGIECCWRGEIPHYSTSISDAWLVVEKMREQKYYVGFECSDSSTENLCPDEDGKWYAGFCIGTGTWNAVCADTLPEAICKSALLALGGGTQG